MSYFWQLCMWPVSFPPPKPLSLLWNFAPHTLVVVENLSIKLWCSLKCWKSNVFLLLFRWRFPGASNGYLPPPPQTSWCVFQERARWQRNNQLSPFQEKARDQNGREMSAKQWTLAGVGRLACACDGFSGSSDLPRRLSPFGSALHPPTFHCPAHRSPFIPINSTALWLVIIWIMFRDALKYWRLELHRSARSRRSTRTFPPPNLSRSRGLPPDFYPPDFLPPDHLVSYQFMFWPGAHPAGDPQWESEDCQRPGLPAPHISFNRNLNWVGKYSVF